MAWPSNLVKAPGDGSTSIYHFISKPEERGPTSFPGTMDDADAELTAAFEYVSRNWAPEVMDAYEVVGRLQHRNLLITGCPVFDQGLTRGGFTQGHHVELIGGTRSGKTTMCIQSAVVAANRGQRVAFIDTCCSFQPERADQILRHHIVRQREEAALSEGRRGPVPQPTEAEIVTALNLIHVLKSHSIYDLVKKLDLITSELQEFHQRGDKPPLDLLIIDSLSALLVPNLGAPPKTPVGYALMQSLGRMLRFMADRFNVVVMTTCHLVGGEGANAAESVRKPALRDVWLSQPDVRIELTAPEEAVQEDVDREDGTEHQLVTMHFQRPWTAGIVTCAGGAAGRRLAFQITDRGLDEPAPHYS